MDHSRHLRSVTTAGEWDNQQAARLDRLLLESAKGEVIVREMVLAWQRLDLLGTHLADELKDFFAAIVGDLDGGPELLSNVDWYEMAERYAYRYAGVTNGELDGRLERAQQRREA